jgi:magnesium transporter
MARTRVYQDGALRSDGLPVDEALAQRGAEAAVWIDLGPGQLAELDGLAERLGLHPLSVHEALDAHPRATVLHHADHDFVSLRALRFDAKSGAMTGSRIAVFLCPDVMLTVRSDDGFPTEAMVGIWDSHVELCHGGTGFLLHGLLKETLQSQYDAVLALDDALTGLEGQLFADHPDERYLQDRSHRLRRSVVEARRFTRATPDTLDELYEYVPELITPQLAPYFSGVRHHADRVTEWAESLRDTVANIMQSRMALHDSRMSVISKRVTGWAALIAIPAVISGFYGINVPFPGVDREWGFAVFCGITVALFIALYAVFRKRDWL